MKIFLVEDNDVILTRLRNTIAEVPGAEVIAEADQQDEAVAGIEAARPDVVILDLTLARGNGIEVLRRIRPLRPNLRIIVLTNKSDPAYRSRCMALGADLFLDKTREFEQLPRHLAAFTSLMPE